MRRYGTSVEAGRKRRKKKKLSANLQALYRGTLGADWPSAAKSDKKDHHQPGWTVELYFLGDVTDQEQAVYS